MRKRGNRNGINALIRFQSHDDEPSNDVESLNDVKSNDPINDDAIIYASLKNGRINALTIKLPRLIDEPYDDVKHDEYLVETFRYSELETPS